MITPPPAPARRGEGSRNDDLAALVATADRLTGVVGNFFALLFRHLRLSLSAPSRVLRNAAFWLPLSASGRSANASIRLGLGGGVILLLLLVLPARAQLAQSFYNITGIETKTLPNAIQITIKTDGTVNLGVDFSEFLHYPPTAADPNFYALPLSSFRLRFAGAKAKLPAFVDIGKYPADSAVVTLGQGDFANPFFYQRDDDPSQTDPTIPRVDIQFRFFVPIKVNTFSFIFGRYYGWTINDSNETNPRLTSIVVSPDRSSVIITVTNDRVEINRNIDRLNRSPATQQKHRLTVRGNGTVAQPLTVDALHVPLAQLLSEVSVASGLSLAVRPDAAQTDISLFLPRVSVQNLVETLAAGFDFTVTAQGETGYEIGRGGTSLATERVNLRNIAPDSTRLLFPDFLLSSLRSDTEHNAMVVSGTPRLIAHLRRDLETLDKPRPQVRVEAQVYEITASDDERFALKGTFASGKEAFDTGAETASVVLKPGQMRSTALVLQALIAKGRARLIGKPSVLVASGAKGVLFGGQTRFINVLQNVDGQQNASVIQLPIGTTLTVTPTVGEAGEILLNLSPRFTTVDSIETGTGLPTVGIREIHSIFRLRDTDTVLIAALESASEQKTWRHFAPFARIPLLRDLFRSRVSSGTRTSLVVFVTAKLVGSGAAPTS